jgi:hypothetical protein
MMFDPASLGQALQPGDKMSVTFSKGQPKVPGGSFMDNATQAGMIPGASGPAGAPPAPMAPPAPPAPMGAPGAGVDPAMKAQMMQALMARGQ